MRLEDSIVIGPGDGLFEGKGWKAYKDHLVKREAYGRKVSEKSLTHFNRLGYYGIYQFGVQALEDIGFLKQGSYKKYRAKKGLTQEQFLKDNGNWNGNKNLGWFSKLANQEDAIKQLTEKNYQRLSPNLEKKGIDTHGSIYSYLTAAHLGGIGNARKYVNKGSSNFADKNNTKMSDYKKSFDEFYKKNIGEDSKKAQFVRGDSNPGRIPAPKDINKVRDAVDLVMSKVDMKDSTFDNDAHRGMRDALTEIMNQEGRQFSPDGNILDKTISRAYDNTEQEALRTILAPPIVGEDVPSTMTPSNTGGIGEMKAPANTFAEGGELTDNESDPPKKKKSINVYTYNPSMTADEYEYKSKHKDYKEAVKNYTQRDGVWHDNTFSKEFERGRKVLDDQYETVNHVPVYEGGKLNDIIRQNKGGDAMIMDHSGNRLGGTELRAIDNALNDAGVENCYMGICNGEKYAKDLSVDYSNVNYNFTPEQNKWEGFNPGKSGEEGMFPKGSVQYKSGKKYAQGGPLQPNGRRTTFRRPEDIKAQNRTI